MANAWAPADPAAQLREYVLVLRTRKWTILAIASIVLAGALVVSYVRTPEYTSTARVLVKPLSVTTLRAPDATPPNMNTERELASSSLVALSAAESLDLDLRPDELVENLRVSVSTGTELLEFRYTAGSPAEAQRRNAAFAAAYLEFRTAQAIESLRAASAPIQRRIQSLNAQLAVVSGSLLRTNDAAQRLALQAESNALTGQIALEQQSLASLVRPEELIVGETVEPADAPLDPSSPNHLVDGILALLAGLALGVGVAFLRERIDDRVRTSDDLRDAAGASVLGAVPAIGSARKASRTAALLSDRSALASEAYRAIRSSLLFAAERTGARTVLVTSAIDGEGKTTVAANLGAVLAHPSRRVVLVEADLRRPQSHHSFSREGSPGLAEVLRGSLGLTDAVVPTPIENLYLLPAGASLGGQELNDAKRIEGILRELGAWADLTLVDTGPLLVVADAIALAPVVDGVVIVANAETTARAAIRKARQQLDLVDAHVLGAILNMAGEADAAHDYLRVPEAVVPIEKPASRVGDARRPPRAGKAPRLERTERPHV